MSKDLSNWNDLPRVSTITIQPFPVPNRGLKVFDVLQVWGKVDPETGIFKPMNWKLLDCHKEEVTARACRQRWLTDLALPSIDVEYTLEIE